MLLSIFLLSIVMCMLFMGRKIIHPFGSFEDETLFGKIHSGEISRHGNRKWCFIFVFFSIISLGNVFCLSLWVIMVPKWRKQICFICCTFFKMLCYGLFNHVCCVYSVVRIGIGIFKEGGIVLVHKKIANKGTIMFMKEGLECLDPWRPIVRN